MATFLNTPLMHTSNTRGFTLAEVLISIALSAIILSLVGSFIVNGLNAIGGAHRYSIFLEDFESFKFQLNHDKHTFLTGAIIIDNTSNGSDTLMLTNIQKDSGVIWGVVNRNTMKLENSSTQYNIYDDKVIGYRQVNASEIAAIQNSVTNAYNYQFFPDKLFEHIKIIDFQLDFFNDNQILNTMITVHTEYSPHLNGTSLVDLESDTMNTYNINF